MFSTLPATQILDAAGASQTSLGTIGLADWSVAGTGNGSAEAWYEGNIQTCASKGMRLPTLYETATNQPASTHQPTVDGIPTAWGGANGVPSSTVTWTASASTFHANTYWVWSDASPGISNYYNLNTVRCVLP